DGAALMAGFAVTGLNMLSVGSVSLLCSVTCRSVLSAVVTSYAAVFAFSMFCMAIPGAAPWVFLQQLDNRVEAAWQEWEQERASAMRVSGPGLPVVVPPPAPAPNPHRILLGMLAVCSIPHILVFLVCSRIAVGQLREMCLDPGPPEQRPVPEVRLTSYWGPEG